MWVLVIIAAAIVFWYVIGYRIYAGMIDRDLFQPDDSRPTPAIENPDDTDFAPAPLPVLFGHHFASIAGAGPIIGPIVAIAAFGWAPVLIWTLLGSVLIGAVHDYTTLMISVRNGGGSIANIAEKAMGSRAQAILAVFLVLTLILIVTIFGVVGAKTLTAEPQLVIPSFMAILIAILFGVALMKFKVPLVLATFVAVGFNIIFLFVGHYVPVNLTELIGLSASAAHTVWFVLLLAYAAVASIMPVQLLLQPRDYISTFNLYFALVLGIAALIFVHPEIQAAPFSGTDHSQGPMFPMLFVLVACGAISGFHSLVSSGTSSKQLAKESHGRAVGFGAMLVEGLLALMTLLLVATAFSFVEGETTLPSFNEEYSKGWIVVFGRGFGEIVHKMLPVMTVQLGALIGMITINIFVLTTLDTATRITRFMVQEATRKRVPVLANKYVATGMIIVVAFVLGITNSWKAIWPVFGASNQLMAAMALIVVTAYLVGMRKPTRYTLLPAIFMIFTTISALGWKIWQFLSAEKVNYTLAGVALVLVILALLVAQEGYKVLVSTKRPQT